MSKVLLAISMATLLLIAFSTALVWRGFEIEIAIAKVWEQRFRAATLADELRQSSDDLTRMARTYAATGNDRYRRHFQEILDIRDGKAPRPKDYHLIYWDLVTAAGVLDARPREAGVPVPLRSLMHDAGFTDEELALLQESEGESNALTQLESDAFKAVDAGDLQAAQALLHSDSYHRAKAQIMLPIQHFGQAMDIRTAHEIKRLSAQKNALDRYFLATTSVLLALVVIGLILAWVAVRYDQRMPED